MIYITSDKDCCGCGACSQICSTKCITLKEDDKGFVYPIVNVSACIGCNLCNKVCPMENITKNRKPLDVYAVKNTDDKQRLLSSSGGVFSVLAEFVIGRGGVVFGAKFDENFNVYHSYAECNEGIEDFKGAKYVQSLTGDSFRQAKNYLKQNRQVLYSGTPCQIAGLKLYLGKKYDNLTTVEIVCHGVPSPLILREYIHSFNVGGKQTVTDIKFRDKSTGWHSYSVLIMDGQGIIAKERASDNLYMKGFLKNLYLRPSCFNCRFKIRNSYADFTIGDFWGIEKISTKFDDKKGCSVVLLNNKKAIEMFNELSVEKLKVSFKEAWKENMAIIRCMNKIDEPRSKVFWRIYQKEGLNAIKKVLEETNVSNRVKEVRHKILLKRGIWSLLHNIKKYMQLKLIEYGKK